MKGFKYAAAAGAVAIGLGAVGAAKADSVVTFNLTGTVDSVCGVFGDTVNTIDVDFGDLGTALDSDWITSGPINLRYICNSAGTFDRAITSTNSGLLANTNGIGGLANEVVYEMQHEDVSGLGLGLTNGDAFEQLLNPVVDSNYDSTDFASFVTEQVRFRARGVISATDGSVTKTQGTYTDVVTVAVTANF